MRTAHEIAFAPASLPLSLPPRGLSRIQAAEYIGVGTSKFDELVAEGKMPRPKKIGSRTVWDRLQLDEAFAGLDIAAEPGEPKSTRGWKGL
jgi:predicted DNA-binding transcriptional regulator AlpA